MNGHQFGISFYGSLLWNDITELYYGIMSCLVMAYRVMSCPGLWHVVSCHVLPGHVMSGHLMAGTGI